MKTNILKLTLALILSTTLSLAHSQIANPLETVDTYLKNNLSELGLSNDDISNYIITDNYQSKHNGVTHIYLNQTHNNTLVFNGVLNVNLLSDGTVLNIGNKFVSDLNSKVNTTSPAVLPEEAVQTVINEFKISTENSVELLSQENNNTFLFKSEGIALEDIEVQLVYEVQKDETVRLAWKVKLYEIGAQHWWNARIDAISGEILNYHDQVIHCNFDSNESSCSNPEHKHSPNSIKKESLELAPTPPETSAYNVFAMPVESPSHGGRELVISPSDETASPFGWHDTNGIDGPEFTNTQGNNVHAYHDIFSLNSSLGDEPEGGTSLNFDFPLNLSEELPYGEVDPSITNLFYWNNILHDVMYQYGFDESSGNFQLNNYGNGGQAGDFVRAEGLDGSFSNNANFGTDDDGSTSRMQMFLWTDDNLPESGGTPDLIVLETEDVAGDYAQVQAAFGGALPNPGIISEVVLVDDGVDIGSDACEELINGSDIDGKIAMIDRGDCEFGAKVLKAENEGAVAVIMCNNVTDDLFSMGAGDDGDQVTIPAVMVSLATCNTLKTALPELTVELMGGDPQIPEPGPSGIDGGFDNGIVCHEYGHGISIRLTGGPSNGGCLFNDEQAGEGWSDFFALVLTTDVTNTAVDIRGIATYASEQPTDGNGIRTFPYSRDFDINEHTYADISFESVPHGVGSVWCAMIWDLYWNMVDVHGFDNDIYNGDGGNNMALQLVIDGLKLQPCNPNFIDSRDAILAADVANYDGANRCLIWETFARRGLGESASAGGNEAFDVPADCDISSVIEMASNTNFSVVPNPNNGSFQVVLDDPSISTARVEVVNELGQIVESSGISSMNSRVDFDLQDLAKGIYFVKFYFNTSVDIEKVVID